MGSLVPSPTIILDDLAFQLYMLTELPAAQVSASRKIVGRDIWR